YFSPVTLPLDSYTLSLHDALPIYWLFLDSYPFRSDVRLPTSDLHLPSPISHLPSPPSYLHIHSHPVHGPQALEVREGVIEPQPEDRKSTRLNSSHVKISYAVFCLK